MTRHTAVLTISDSVSAGLKPDLSGPAVCRRLEELGWTCESHLVPDEARQISDVLRTLANSPHIAAIFTTGGTGVALRDVTPEATRSVIEREIPGLAESMRFEGRRFTPRSVLSRGVAGTRGKTLIVNLPGSPKGAVQSLDAIGELIPHVVDLLHGKTEHEPGRETAQVMRTSEH